MRALLRYASVLTASSAIVVAPLVAQTNTFVPGTQYVSPAIVTDFTTSGAEMIGMQVTWTFLNGSTGFDTWRLLAPSTWGVSGGGFSVQNNTANTFTGAWNVVNGTNLGVASIRFNGASGRTLFDCAWTGTACNNNGSLADGTGDPTVGSAGGSSHTRIGGNYTGLVTGQYANLVGIGGAAPVGDLFEQLTISFTGGLGAGQTYDYYADTDNSDFRLPPPTTTVPEPGTYALLAAGLAALAVLRRRRRATGLRMG